MGKSIETVRQPVVGNTLWQNTHILKQENGCEISSSHGGEYDVQSCLLGCTAM
jgi:hypothetical protein